MRALRALQHLSSRGCMLPSSTMRVRDGSLGDSFRRFLVGEKTTYLSPLSKEKRVLFFAKRKERKETANVPFDRLCGWQRFDGGYKRRHPRSRGSRDPRAAAIFVDIMPDGAHAARALRLRARSFQRQSLPARRMLACRAKREQTTVGSRVYALLSSTMRVRDGVSVSLLVLFFSVRKAHIFLLFKGENACFSLQKEKHQKNCKPPA